MLEVVGYIIGAMTLIAGVFINLVRRVDSTLLRAIGTIKDEFEFAYREFGTVTGEGRESERLKTCTRRMRRLHYSSLWDLLKLKIIEWILGKTILLVICIIVFVAISLVLGHTIFSENQLVLRFIFLVGIPFILFVVEVVFVGWVLKREGYLKRVIDRYEKQEY